MFTMGRKFLGILIIACVHSLQGMMELSQSNMANCGQLVVIAGASALQHVTPSLQETSSTYGLSEAEFTRVRDLTHTQLTARAERSETRDDSCSSVRCTQQELFALIEQLEAQEENQNAHLITKALAQDLLGLQAGHFFVKAPLAKMQPRKLERLKGKFPIQQPEKSKNK